jgi:hypothetical protein
MYSNFLSFWVKQPEFSFDCLARLRKPQDGLFGGVIDALDTVNSTYRITFDRTGLGTYSVPDIDVLVCYSIVYYFSICCLFGAV